MSRSTRRIGQRSPDLGDLGITQDRPSNLMSTEIVVTRIDEKRAAVEPE